VWPHCQIISLCQETVRRKGKKEINRPAHNFFFQDNLDKQEYFAWSMGLSGVKSKPRAD
jgi:hypothetical protein